MKFEAGEIIKVNGRLARFLEMHNYVDNAAYVTYLDESKLVLVEFGKIQKVMGSDNDDK